ncbi:uncharacterized protein LOC113291593 [Papaver somniferum]|uniref:uncharacterized protein LOC113291593 n=1 Tax=Papaver somniferum TaxID=3469 RepID=UPI000E6FA328|nr:uncharacterized protein LOC113291593 [Papaver somniferum]
MGLNCEGLDAAGGMSEMVYWYVSEAEIRCMLGFAVVVMAGVLYELQVNEISLVIWVCDGGGIQRRFSTSNPIYFDGDFDVISSVITEADNVVLNMIPTDTEIENVVKSMASWSSPGPDGFQAGFYQTQWQIVGKDVIEVVKRFFQYGHMLRSLNKTYISLIPKCKSPKMPSEFRPIGLCNVSYKIISKILANIIKPFLKKLVSPYQAAFVPGREIHDNIIIAHEMIHFMKHKEGYNGTMAIKLDLSKAFDRLEWKFLNNVLLKFGFNTDFCNLIMQCVTTTSISVLLMGHHVNNLSQLEHVNDIFNISENFSSLSGQMLNFDKSCVYFSHNLSPGYCEFLSRALNMSIVSDSGKYLGAPLLLGHSKVKSFDPIVQSFEVRLKNFVSITLNQAGRSTLTTLIDKLNSLPTYQMGCFKIPTTLIDKLDSLQLNFWWGHNTGKGIKFIYWDSINKSKEQGGLGFRDLENFNIALICKLIWKIVTEEEKFKVQILSAKYFKDCSILHLDKLNESCSWIWRGIYRCIGIIKDNSFWSIGCGTKTKIWLDCWVVGLDHPPIPSTGLVNIVSFIMSLICLWKILSLGMSI